MSYLDQIFLENIDKTRIKSIFEVGSRDLEDGINLVRYYDVKTYSFECNPDGLIRCRNNLNNLPANLREKITLVDKAVSQTNGEIDFYPFDPSIDQNIGASSALVIRWLDSNHINPTYKISVPSTRLDTFIDSNNIAVPDLICMDLQGYEMEAFKSLGNKLSNVKYIITEASINNVYIQGVEFCDLENYLKNFGFKHKCSNMFGYNNPPEKIKDYLFWDSMFINENI